MASKCHTKTAMHQHEQEPKWLSLTKFLSDGLCQEMILIKNSYSYMAAWWPQVCKNLESFETANRQFTDAIYRNQEQFNPQT